MSGEEDRARCEEGLHSLYFIVLWFCDLFSLFGWDASSTARARARVDGLATEAEVARARWAGSEKQARRSPSAVCDLTAPAGG
jgi:hypothetical protein